MEHKTCERCNAEFTCNVSNISNCWCMDVQVNAAAKGMIAASYNDCLCEKCLKEIALETAGKPLTREELKPNEHYYFNEKGLMVLTATYLLRRGYCCENGCLHCPYGFRK